jgi:hypothetical protein
VSPFVEIDRLLWMRKTYGISSEDMDSAFAAAGFKTPFLAVRIVSDLGYRSDEFQPVAGEYCAAFVTNLVRTLGGPVAPATPATPPEQPSAGPDRPTPRAANAGRRASGVKCHPASDSPR